MLSLFLLSSMVTVGVGLVVVRRRRKTRAVATD